MMRLLSRRTGAPARAGLRAGVARLLLLPVVAALLAVFAAPAHAAGEADIDHIQEVEDGLQILLSLPNGVTPDLGSVSLTIGEEKLPATAVLASDAESIVRTTILAFDLSQSMEGARFEAAKQAAHLFLDNAPAGVRVGLLGFGSRVERLAEPTTDHAAIRARIDQITLLGSTKLFEGVAEAVSMAGTEGARSILLISDGVDNSKSQIAVATAALGGSGEGSNRVKLDAIAIQPNAEATQQLTTLVEASTGKLFEAATPEAMSALFQSEAETLRSQILVTSPLTDALLGQSGNLEVSIDAGGTTYSDGAFVSIAKPVNPDAGLELIASDGGFSIPASVMWIGLGAACLSLLTILFFALGAGAPKKDTVDKSIEAYTREGARKLAASRKDTQQSVTQQAVGAAAKVLQNNKGIEIALGQRLEAAGLALKPAEWLLIHAGIAVAAGFVGIALGGGSWFLPLLFIVGGLAGPWGFLLLKHTRRLRAFKAQLADTLQLMSGSLSAGLSLAQAADTVVREGTDPMASEFRRALIETRLGVAIEDALEGVAGRMDSKDFEWIVMAIRIQREVGGNLAELLDKVAETIREREYLERQVQSLSAEGRLSVWILGGLPPAFMAYLAVANRAYLEPMFNTTLGIAMLVLMGIMEVAGVLWMKKVVKVEI